MSVVSGYNIPQVQFSNLKGHLKTQSCPSRSKQQRLSTQVEACSMQHASARHALLAPNFCCVSIVLLSTSSRKDNEKEPMLRSKPILALRWDGPDFWQDTHAS